MRSSCIACSRRASACACTSCSRRARCRTSPRANVIAEIRGSERPDEIVLIGGHLDSWDLGTGAIDDGSGVVMVMETMRAMKELGIRPKRTIRGVLFMNEENGLRGGRKYFENAAKREELQNHVAAIESDAGAATPVGFITTLEGKNLERLAGAHERCSTASRRCASTAPSTPAPIRRR